MSKIKHDIASQVMDRIHSEHISIRPRWHFLVISISFVTAFVFLIISSVFMVSLTAFSLRTHGPLGPVRFQQLISSFPWWAPLLAVVFVGLSLYLLKKFDFSYKHSFLALILSLVISVILAGLLLDYSGLDLQLAGHGPMRGLYQPSVSPSALSPGRGRFR